LTSLGVARTGQSGAGPALVCISAALASLAFFKVWVLFSMSLAGPGEMELRGADLAREIRGAVPWLYVTPTAILLILVVSGARLIEPSARVRWTYSIAITVAALILLSWPIPTLSKMVTRFSHLQSIGEGTVRLTLWWWAYGGSLSVVITVGIIEFVSTFRSRLRNKLES